MAWIACTAWLARECSRSVEHTRRAYTQNARDHATGGERRVRDRCERAGTIHDRFTARGRRDRKSREREWNQSRLAFHRKTMFYTGSWIDSVPENFQWSNATLVTKGMAPYGAVALGEID